MKEKTKILFIYKSHSPFIETDLVILKKHFEVTCLVWKGVFNLRNLADLIRKTRKADISFIWFEYYRSLIAVLIAKMFRKKSVVIAAGAVTLAYAWETQKHLVRGHNVPGLLLFSKLAVKWADKVLAVSEYKKSGILKHVALDNIEVVPNCFDYVKYSPSGRKENLILTASYLTRENIERKGLVLFLKLAEFFPEHRFVIIGRDLDGSGKLLTAHQRSNSEVITDFIDTDIITYMQRASVYAQLSSMESFGAALAEAMLCECIPVAADSGSLPEVLGDVGALCRFNDLPSTVEAVRKAIANPSWGQKARERIKTNYPIEKREEKIKDVISNLG